MRTQNLLANALLALVVVDASFLLTGDLEAAGEEALLRSDAALASTVLKVPHHGSRTSTTPAFLREVQPAIAIISVGQDNPYGHPSPAVIDRLESLADRIAIVHLGDSREPPQSEENRCALGSGEVPLAEIVVRLSEAGYEGFFDVELIGEEIEMADYRDVLCQSKQFVDELLLVAR